jgi:hypothetical protein
MRDLLTCEPEARWSGGALPVVSMLPRSDPPQARGTACVLCVTPIHGAHYELSGRPTCPRCRAGLDDSAWGSVGFGMLAGAACTLLYYAVLHSWGVRFAFIAVVTGVIVGSVVRRLAGVRWPTLARWLALAITYLSVSMTHLDAMLEIAPGAPFLEVLRNALLAPLGLSPAGHTVAALVVFAIGLHEAWQFSKAPAIHIAGPFRVVDE